MWVITLPSSAQSPGLSALRNRDAHYMARFSLGSCGSAAHHSGPPLAKIRTALFSLVPLRGPRDGRIPLMAGRAVVLVCWKTVRCADLLFVIALRSRQSLLSRSSAAGLDRAQAPCNRSRQGLRCAISSVASLPAVMLATALRASPCHALLLQPEFLPMPCGALPARRFVRRLRRADTSQKGDQPWHSKPSSTPAPPTTRAFPPHPPRLTKEQVGSRRMSRCARAAGSYSMSIRPWAGAKSTGNTVISTPCAHADFYK